MIGDVSRAYAEHFLAPALSSGEVVAMDNPSRGHCAADTSIRCLHGTQSDFDRAEVCKGVLRATASTMPLFLRFFHSVRPAMTPALSNRLQLGGQVSRLNRAGHMAASTTAASGQKTVLNSEPSTRADTPNSEFSATRWLTAIYL
jgi:hypothetical protein